MIVVLMLSLLAWQDQDASAYYIVTVKGQVMAAKAAPVARGNQMHVELLNGQKVLLPAQFIDQAKTDQYNRELAERKRQEEEAARAATEAEAAQREAAAQAAQAQEDAPEVKLTSTRQLRPFQSQRSSGTVSTSQPANPGQPAEEGVIGTPRTNTFNSDQPVYVSREVQTLKADGWRFDGQVSVNDPRGVSEVEVEATIFFDNSTSSTTTTPVPGFLAYGSTSNFSFKLNATENITQVAYRIKFVSGNTQDQDNR